MEESGSIRWKKLMPVALIAAGILAYSNSFSGVFVFDDHAVITESPSVHGIAPVHISPRWLVDQTFRLNYMTGGLKTADYHATNILIHILAGLTLFGIIRRTLSLSYFSRRFDGRESVVAFFCAALWIVHPVQTQSVTYICQRYESMMGLFFLLSLYCFVIGSMSEKKRLWYDLSIVSCVIGMVTKEIMAAAPFVILAYDYIFLSRSGLGPVTRRWRVHLALFLTIGMLVPLLVSTLAREMVATSRFIHISPFLYLLNQCEVISHYLRLVVLPYPLCLDYSWRPSGDILRLLPYVAVICALFVVTVVAVSRRYAAGISGALFFTVLAPTSSLLPVADLAFEHRMYLPLAAVLCLIVISVFGFASRSTAKRFYAVLLPVAGGAVILAFVVLTAFRNLDYRSEEVMWRDVVEKRPDNLRARNDLAVALSEAGKYDEAVKEYNEVFKRIPFEILRKLEEGRIVITDRFTTSTSEYQYFRANVNMGTLLMGVPGKEKEAALCFVKALRVAPFNSNVQEKLNNILKKTNVSEIGLDPHVRILLTPSGGEKTD